MPKSTLCPTPLVKTYFFLWIRWWIIYTSTHHGSKHHWSTSTLDACFIRDQILALQFKVCYVPTSNKFIDRFAKTLIVSLEILELLNLECMQPCIWRNELKLNILNIPRDNIFYSNPINQLKFLYFLILLCYMYHLYDISYPTWDSLFPCTCLLYLCVTFWIK